MSTSNTRRGLGPIRNHHDCQHALDEMGALIDKGELASFDERVYRDQLCDVIRAYKEWCPDNSLKADPHSMLRYQLSARSLDIASVAREIGIADLKKLAAGQRTFTNDDVARLATYFGCPVDAFGWKGYKDDEGWSVG